MRLDDVVHLRSSGGETYRVERMASYPEVAVISLGNGTRYALPSRVAFGLLSSTTLDEDQKIRALTTYPNLVPASSEQDTFEKLSEAESRRLPPVPPDAVAPEVMGTPELREMAFPVPRGFFDLQNEPAETNAPR